MSHVISAQPSATSPYQPTALQEGSGDNPPRVHRIDSEQHDDCCIHTRNKKGCCLYLCTLLSMCCQGIKNCTESCCDCCANCLTDCCEDKPRERTQRIHKRYRNSSYYDNTADDWAITSIPDQYVQPSQELIPSTNDNYNSSTHHTSGFSRHDSGKHHSSGHHDSGTHHTTSHHDSSTHHTSSHHDTGTHHTSSHHDSGTHHTSSHDTSCYDSGGGDTGGTCDSGGGDTGGGDCGGGCDD